MELNRKIDKPLTDAEKLLEIEFEKESMIKETIATAVSKVSFINEIKQGLGNEIKSKGSQVTIINKTRTQNIIDWLKKIFTKF